LSSRSSIPSVRLLTSFLLLVSISGLPLIYSPTTASAQVIKEQFLGFDTCAAPTTAYMNAWSGTSPFDWIGIYIGGVNRTCSQPNLNASWVTTVSDYGWGLVPIWAGSEDPCYTAHPATLFSLNVSTAYLQGGDEAVSAIIELSALGMSPSIAGNDEIAYDMEGYNGTSGCIAAEESFVKGWDAKLQAAPNVVAGVYGSTEASYISSLTGSPAPNFIWGADADNNPDTTVMLGVPTGDWVNHQRLKQYTAGHNETFGGDKINIDRDNADGPIYYQ
jgi:hypothetical protein